MSIKHMKRCSGPLLQKCQSNCNQVSLTPLRRVILQKIYKDEMLQRARETGNPPTLWAGVEMGGCGQEGKQFLKILTIDLVHVPASPLLGLDPERTLI